MRYRAGVLRCAPVASLLRLPTLGYTFVSPFRSVRFRAGVRSRLIALRFTLRAAFGSLSLYVRLCRPSGCLRQATQPAPAGMCSLPRFHTILFPLAIALAYYDNKTVAPPNVAKNW